MHRLAPALLCLAAIESSAQMSMPRVDTRPNVKSSIDLAYGSVGSGAGDYDGSAASARLYFHTRVFVSISRNDVAFDTGGLRAHQFAYGIGTSEAWGQGSVTAAYARSKVSGDIPGIGQDLFSLGYEAGLAANLTAGLTVMHTLNAGNIEDVTAAIFSARYEVINGLSLTASYSSEDTLLGQAGAKRTWTVGARYSF